MLGYGAQLRAECDATLLSTGSYGSRRRTWVSDSRNRAAAFAAKAKAKARARFDTEDPIS
jgi:hypothetical protein